LQLGPRVWTVFRMNSASGEDVLFGFVDSPYGAYPYSSLLRDSTGSLYGTLWGGATSYVNESWGQARGAPRQQLGIFVQDANRHGF
jgi:hypothetical protein